MARVVVQYQPPTPPPGSRTEEVSCQFCGKRAPRPEDTCRGLWGTGIDVNSVEIRRELGYSCPDGGSKEVEFYDACPACWTSKIRPALDALLLPGEQIETSESDW